MKRILLAFYYESYQMCRHGAILTFIRGGAVQCGSEHGCCVLVLLVPVARVQQRPKRSVDQFCCELAVVSQRIGMKLFPIWLHKILDLPVHKVLLIIFAGR